MMAIKSTARNSTSLTRFNLRYFRKQARMTQGQLAKTLDVSQTLISRWEKEGRVPDNVEAQLREIFGLTYEHLDDIEICGSDENAAAWLRYLNIFEEHISETGHPEFFSEVRDMGLRLIFSPLTDAGFTMPIAPSIPEDV